MKLSNPLLFWRQPFLSIFNLVSKGEFQHINLDKIQVQTEELAKDKSEISKLEARLFHRKAEVERLEKKEDLR